MTPTVQTNGKPLTFGGRQVGQYAVELDTGNIVIAMWKPLFRIKDSYALSCGLSDQIDDEVNYFYVVDTDNGDVRKFDVDTYFDAPIFHFNDQRQFVPKKHECLEYWPDAEDEIFGDF